MAIKTRIIYPETRKNPTAITVVDWVPEVSVLDDLVPGTGVQAIRQVVPIQVGQAQVANTVSVNVFLIDFVHWCMYAEIGS